MLTGERQQYSSVGGGATGGDLRGAGCGEVMSQTLARRNVAKMLIAVVWMFAICYLPVHLLNILRYVCLTYVGTSA